MTADFRYAWHFVTRTYQCQVQWATDRELQARWRAGWTTRTLSYAAPTAEQPLLAVGWRDEAGMQVRLARSQSAHPHLGDALLSLVNWLMLLAPNAQTCALDAGRDAEPAIFEQRPVPGPLPRTVRSASLPAIPLPEVEGIA